ncbi:MAG: hypothetical protein ACQESS_09395 [Bacillota bacterium]
MSGLDFLECPECGGLLRQHDINDDVFVCEHCGKETVLEDMDPEMRRKLNESLNIDLKRSKKEKADKKSDK